jgi:hypothetical protein
MTFDYSDVPSNAISHELTSYCEPAYGLLAALLPERAYAMSSEDDVLIVAGEIERYLASHPNAADSADGIQRWWLARLRYEESLIHVQKALDYLEQSGAVAKSEIGGRVVYTLALRKD